MIREETVFGPIFSRRLGSSLGINLLPEKGKICNFDCIYCECGWNRDGRNDTVLPSALKVRTDLERMLVRLVKEGTPVDSITFSGDGEPTLNPEFPQIIDDTLRLRAQYYPSAKVSVLSNATRVHISEVFNALQRVDNPIMKLDAPTNELVAKINMPAPGYDVQRVIEALKQRFPNIIGPDAGDLCYATGNRQAAVLDLCSKVDMLLVVGAKNSSNSSRLMELGLEQGIPSHLIASVEDLEPEWFENIESVGISSGASAPEVLVQGVVDWIKEKFAPVEIENFVKLVESTKFNLPKALQD